MKIKVSRSLCVLGAVESEMGKEIADELKGWLSWYYEVFTVWHDGSLFEQPALRFAQDLAKLTNKPILYLHTKGAYNKPDFSARVRKMWRQEFAKDPNKYFATVKTDAPAVACPFTGDDRMTRYNGFVANAAAWRCIPDIEPNSDRMVFEKLWRDSPANIFGLINDNINHDTLWEAHAYLKKL